MDKTTYNSNFKNDVNNDLEAETLNFKETHLINIKETNLLMMSLYLYLNSNNYKKTAETLYNELKFDRIFQFPENKESTEITEMFRIFFMSRLLNPDSDSEITTFEKFWNVSWEYFCKKIDSSYTNQNSINNILEKANVKIQYDTYNIQNVNNVNNDKK